MSDLENRPAQLYVSAAVDGAERFRRMTAAVVPRGTFAEDGSDASGAQLHEAFLALIGLGMVQLDYLGDDRLAGELRATVYGFLSEEGYHIPLCAAYEAVWRAGASDEERARRAGSLFATTIQDPAIVITRDHARSLGSALWREASQLWRLVGEAT